MSVEQNKAIVTRLFKEMWLKGDLSIADELVAADYILHNGMLPPGRQGLKQTVIMMRETFPAYGGKVEDLVAEGDRAACRWIRYSLHDGDFMNVSPTGKEVTITGMNIYRFVDNKVVEEWIEFDMFGLMRQVGAIPSPE